MRAIEISADRLANALLELSGENSVCLLDGCGVAHPDSRFLIAGVNPVETARIENENPLETLRFLDEKLSQAGASCIFTIAYEFGLKQENIKPRAKEFSGFPEPDVYLARFDALIVHDYEKGRTYLTGNEKKFDEIESLLASRPAKTDDFTNFVNSKISSNFTRDRYVAAIEKIKESIRRGDTYQTNLTRQIRALLPAGLTAQEIFRRLRRNHPAPFAAFVKRDDDFVVSISPERFFKVQNQTIETSPIKGTRPRGKSEAEDLRLRDELLSSEKDRAENVMIVDLLRNDIGRICEFGSVAVEKLCALETHPTLFHLVSTIKGELRGEIKFSDVIKAVFPCGSITGAPKISTMKIIDDIETAPRGLSMGAIGYSIADSEFRTPNLNLFDLSVAIRTMVVRGREAIFNVGGGVVIDSDAREEYAETETKARALLNALNGTQ